MVMRRVGRTVIATLLCGSLAALTASSTALAQGRGNSGLPAGAGNPHADLQRQIKSLEQQMESLGMEVEVLSSQMGQGSGSDRKLAVYDAIEQKVGDVVGVELNVPWVGLTVNNRTFVLQVTPQQLVGQFLWFGDSTCMGPQVYISGFQRNGRTGGAHVFALAAVHADGTVYVADANTPPVQQPIGSVLNSNGTCSASVGTQTVVPATPLPLNVYSVYQRPFTVR
jgi:hypothetical protein